MIDIKFIVENPGLIKAGSAKKHVKVDIDKIVELYNLEKKRCKAEALELGKMKYQN